MNEDKAKLLDNLEAWKNCPSTRCEDCEFSDPFAVKRICTAMDSADLIDLALKVIKNDEILLKSQEPVEPRRYYEGHLMWLCGNCGTPMYHSYDDGTMEDAKKFVHFCRKCGGPVKWE